MKDIERVSTPDQNKTRSISSVLSNLVGQPDPKWDAYQVKGIKKGQHHHSHLWRAKHITHKKSVKRGGDIECRRADHQGSNQPLKWTITPHQPETLGNRCC